MGISLATTLSIQKEMSQRFYRIVGSNWGLSDYGVKACRASLDGQPMAAVPTWISLTRVSLAPEDLLTMPLP
jgi:hypothetical protein